jgi:helix-turn-helix protein
MNSLLTPGSFSFKIIKTYNTNFYIRELKTWATLSVTEKEILLLVVKNYSIEIKDFLK